MKLFISLSLISNIVFSQAISTLKNRFNTYINFNGSLTQLVAFNDNSISILNSGKPEFTVYSDELAVVGNLLKQNKITDQVTFYQWKKNKHLSKNQLDSLSKINALVVSPISKSLKGKKIAIDPGHFAGNMEVARIEQKYLYFAPTPTNKLKDTIQFNEGTLTYQTAYVLKHLLEDQGAIVMVTRPLQNYTSFQTTYDDWFSKRKNIVLDSLKSVDAIDAKRYQALLKLNKQAFFWEFFRDYELAERARIINEFNPDLSIIIHYNVDEKNKDWINPTKKNYTMTFIGGGMTVDNFKKVNNKIHFLRLLLTDQLPQSEKIASLTVNQFEKEMKVPIAKKQDADYLRDNCLSTPSKGVFCRNLLLCRTIISPLVYGECLYQDNENECLQLSVCDHDLYNMKLPKRISEAATCYFNAISAYYKSQ